MRYASVLDHGRTWERMLQRAGIPLAYSQGFNPQPRIQFAGAMPVGYSSACERVDLFLTKPLDAAEFLRSVTLQCPQGLRLVSCRQVDPRSMSLQASLLAAHYVVRLDPLDEAELAEKVRSFMGQQKIVRTRQRKGRAITYNLRDLVHALAVLPHTEGKSGLYMELKCGPDGSGRPEQVVAALGLSADGLQIHRAQLDWQDEVAEA
jgi:radical SAM-linked protein